MANRDNAITNETTSLISNFTLDNQDFAPFEVTKIEIYASLEDANNSLNIVETILPLDITVDDSNSQTGVNSTIKYTASLIATGGAKFDKIYVIPRDGMSTLSFINQFFVRQYLESPTPTPQEKIRVYLNIFDILGTAQKNAKVVWRLNLRTAWYDKDIIRQEKEIFSADDEGNVVMDIIETDTMLKDTFNLIDPNNPTADELKKLFYRVDIADRLTINVRVPKGLVQSSFKDLPTVNP